jgi:hypothetical protein
MRRARHMADLKQAADVSVTFTTTLSQLSTQAIAFSYSTAEVPTKGGTDYVDLTDMGSFAPAEIRKTFVVKVGGATHRRRR